MAETIEKYDDQPAPGAVRTVGNLIAKVEAAWLLQPRTINDYATSLRRVISEVKKVSREEADKVRITDVSHGEIELWRSAYTGLAAV